MQENLVKVKKVKVRIKLGTVPYLGFVDVPPPINRVSDILNSQALFLPLKDVHSLEHVGENSLLLINKKEISYIQALEEREIQAKSVDISTIGYFTQVKILLRDTNIKVLGQIFIPFKDNDLSCTINQTTFFLNLKDVSIEGTREAYSYLAVSKAFIKTIESDGKRIQQH